MHRANIARQKRGTIHPYADPSVSAQYMVCSPFKARGFTTNFYLLDEGHAANVTGATDAPFPVEGRRRREAEGG